MHMAEPAHFDCLLLLLLQAAASGLNADSANLELMQSAVTAEVAKLAGKAGEGKATSEMERDMTDQMVREALA
jgi:hypothetical protein